ncbi:glycosyltransferase [Rhodoferax sp.]|uniref:glycosyltransferase n=1 Tax=Rhodoferax sp. TaxID=50421 RepID=UPI002ACE0339|nr:glycosyltransferase [Rhodoferax sp.]MDZ7921997.1 glycosyltransferase [Rhodoferax sp.]
MFAEILVLALWKDGLPRREAIDDGIEVLRVAPLFGAALKGRLGLIIKVIGWYLGVLWALRGVKVACFNCHSLAVLPLSVLIKWWKACKLVYEPHELETETSPMRGWRRFLARKIERILIPFADAVCLVNRSIADWYRTTYRLRTVWIVKNVPYRDEHELVRKGLLRQTLGLTASDAQVFLYQGGLVHGRGVELLIDAFSGLPHYQHLVFMGFGELEDQIKASAVRQSNIHFMPAVPPELVKEYTVDADVGLSLIENVCLSYYLCLPNKLFEYAACGVPAVVSDFPEMGQFVEEYDCGWKVVPEVQAVRRLIQGMTARELAAKRANTRGHERVFSWQEEEKELMAMYLDLGFDVDGGRYLACQA